MKKVLRLRVLCVTLVLFLIIQVFAVTALAADATEKDVVTTETEEAVESTKDLLQEQYNDKSTASIISPTVNLKAGEKTIDELSLMTVDLKNLSEYNLMNYIDNGHVILAGRTAVYEKNGEIKTSQHMVVIVGYFCIDDRMFLVVKDPGENKYNPYIFRSYEGFSNDADSCDCDLFYTRNHHQYVWDFTLTVA